MNDNKRIVIVENKRKKSGNKKRDKKRDKKKGTKYKVDVRGGSK